MLKISYKNFVNKLVLKIYGMWARKQHATQTNCFDLVIVGGGIVGVSTARELKLRHPQLEILLLEKESKLAAHQSSHNAGVVHADFIPGTLQAIPGAKKAADLIYNYCDEKQLPYKICGKLFVATNAVELTRLQLLYEAGKRSEIPDLKLIDIERIQEIESYCQGIKALWCPNTGIVDWAKITNSLAQDFQTAGGKIQTNFKVSNFVESNNAEYPVSILNGKSTKHTTVQAAHVLTCAGLQSDQLATLTGCARSPRIVPFRGEYLLLKPEKCHMVRGNIYAVPDPRYPSLSVHLTPRLDGSVLLGPSVMLALKREGYK